MFKDCSKKVIHTRLNHNKLHMEQAADCLVWGPAKRAPLRRNRAICQRSFRHPWANVCWLLLVMSFCNHRSLPPTAPSQQIGRGSPNFTVWISPALNWQRRQCLHRGSLAEAVDLICSFHCQIFLLCHAHPAGLHQRSGSSRHFSFDILKMRLLHSFFFFFFP